MFSPCDQQPAAEKGEFLARLFSQGERHQLQHRFRSLVRGCEAVYRERLHAAREQTTGECINCDDGELAWRADC